MADDKNSLDLKRFGRYLILDHLVDGGMAKICRARYLGEQADKIVAIKMVQSQFSSDPNFRKMFMDEVRVSFGLIHPNIAQTYDYGLYKDQLFTAMEYCDGKNLKQFLDRLKVKNFVFPVEISIYIIAQVCQGLTYAHNFTDKLSGKKANIIHRDISPHNIMLTYDGAIKVIDFGIAKAESNSESTKAGTIKGKLSYLAPEYLEGLELDGRYDQFAVGITLWELLCSRKLFTANNELAVLKKVQECKIPAPSSINPSVPKELDQIVLKALSKDRNARYSDMDQFNRALVRLLYAKYPEFNASDLGYFANELFKEEIAEDRKKLLEFGKIEIRPFLDELKKEGNSNNTAGTRTDVNNGQSKLASATREEVRKEIDLGFSEGERTSTKIKTSRRDGDGIELLSEDEQIDVVENNQKEKMSPADGTVPPPVRIRPNSAPVKTSITRTRPMNKASANANVRSMESAKSTSKASLATILFAASIVALIYFQKNKLEDIYSNVISGKMRNPASSKNGKKEVEGIITKSILKLEGHDYDMEVFIDNKKVDYEAFGINVPSNKDIKVTVRKNGHRDFTKRINIPVEQDFFTLKIPALEELTEGMLYSSDNYKLGTVLIINMGDEQIERELPLKDNWRLPAGKYQGTIKNEYFKIEKNVDFEIFDSRRTLLPNE